METTYERYAQLTEQIAILDDERQSLKTTILNDLREKGVETLKTVLGTFSVVKRKTYQYSYIIGHLEDSLKDLKHKEELEGIAIPKEASSLRFQLKAEEKEVENETNQSSN